jgi:hypothetical protein
MMQTKRRVMIHHDVLSWTPGWAISRQENKVTVIVDESSEVSEFE